ncbi:MAG TPA: Ig-like domain-containing protein [Candidatus Limnocylindrales bacterium]|nr:Ig-like domain-containing protein [Candidatus Limnocylindrales bacterium]
MSRRTAERLGLVALLIVLAAVLISATLVDRVPPSVARIFLTRTAGADSVAMTHAAIGVQFSEPVRPSGAEVRLHIDPNVSGAFSWADDRTLLFTPAEKLPNSARFTVVEEAGFEDTAGNAAPSPSAAFAFATVGPPTVASTSPAAGAQGVALDASLVVTFDRLMDTQRTAAAVSLEPRTPLHASWQGQTLTLVPDEGLQPDTAYTLAVGTQAIDTDGNALQAVDQVTFQTIQVGLDIAAVLPADGAAGVALDAPIGLIFGAPVDPTSIAGTLTITPTVAGSVVASARPDDPALPGSPSPGPGSSPSPSPASEAGTSPSPGPTVVSLPSTGGSPIPTTPSPPLAPTPGSSPSPTVSPTPAGTTGESVVLFRPSQPLAPNTTYTVTLRTGAVRGLGSAVAAPGRSWTFTTGPPIEPLQNQILFRSARGGVENVWSMNPDGTGAHEVTSELSPVTAYDVTADGRLLAYSTAGEVKVMSLPSGQVTTVTDPAVAEYAPRLLPDGSAVIVGRRDRATGADQGWWLLPLSGGSGSARQLLPDGAPPLGSAADDRDLPAGPLGRWTAVGAVAPQGHLALLPRGDGSLAVVVVSASPEVTGTPGTIVDVGLTDLAGPAAWSAEDGGFVVVGRDAPAGDLRAWLVSPDGSLQPGPAFAAWSAVASNGSLAGLASGAPGHLAVALDRSASPAVLTTATDFLDREPAFGPGGSALVFVRVSATAPGTSGGIWTVDADGRELRQLSTDGSTPRWLP